jgi:hypothetical protein
VVLIRLFLTLAIAFAAVVLIRLFLTLAIAFAAVVFIRLFLLLTIAFAALGTVDHLIAPVNFLFEQITAGFNNFLF